MQRKRDNLRSTSLLNQFDFIPTTTRRLSRSRNKVIVTKWIIYILSFVLATLHGFVSIYILIMSDISGPTISMLSTHHNGARNLLLQSGAEMDADEQNIRQSQMMGSVEVDMVNTTKSYMVSIEHYDNELPHRPFPRWGETKEEEDVYGIDIEPLMEFILNSSSYAYIAQQSHTHKDRRYIRTTDHKNDVGSWLPETLYVLDHNGLSTSIRHRMCVAYGIGMIKQKVLPIEHAIQSAFEYLKTNQQYTCKLWPRLCRKIFNDGDDIDAGISGFPFFLFFGDFTGCNKNNYKGKYSIPLFTAAAHVRCNYSFPFLTHELLSMIRNETEEWDSYFNETSYNYPWDQKINQVVWRGALTGPYINDTYKNPRWNMLRTIHDRQQSNYSQDDEPFLFNVGAVRLPIRQNNKKWKDDLYEIGGLVDRIDPMDDNQLYRAVLDMDGNSWSSRFNNLLCYNSVVLKVEATWVDYLQYKQQRNENGGIDVLKAWKHYIPVKSDLSDIFEIAAYVMDPRNDIILQQIIGEANRWCRHRLLQRSIEQDVLDTFERYIALLDVGSPNWSTEKWKQVKEAILSSNSSLQMKLLSSDEDANFGKDDAIAYRIKHGLPLHTIKIES